MPPTKLAHLVFQTNQIGPMASTSRASRGGVLRS